MRGRLSVVWISAALCLATACADEDRDHATGSDAGTGPITATTTARGLTAGLLSHLERDHVTSYGGQHQAGFGDVESWSASANLDGEIRTLYVFVQRTPESHDPGCTPDAPFYSEVSCTTAPNGARRSLMVRAKGRDAMPLLQGRTTRPDGTSFLVELWADEATTDAQDLVLELLDDEALGASPLMA